MASPPCLWRTTCPVACSSHVRLHQVSPVGTEADDDVNIAAVSDLDIPGLGNH